MPKAKLNNKPKAKLNKKAVKKVKKTLPGRQAAKLPTMGKPVGVVKHYYSNINVAIIKLKAPVKQGDEIRIMGGEDTDFNQKIISMQIGHKEVKKAKAGAAIGLKVKERAREGYKMYKV